jgi:HicA toxin of bacterial toxin-antitoxin,
MKAKHTKALHSLFALPTRASIAFAEIEALLIALGAEKTEREGSRVKFTLRGVEWHAHRPHPGKEAKKYQVEQVREMLTKLEIKP